MFALKKAQIYISDLDGVDHLGLGELQLDGGHADGVDGRADGREEVAVARHLDGDVGGRGGGGGGGVRQEVELFEEEGVREGEVEADLVLVGLEVVGPGGGAEAAVGRRVLQQHVRLRPRCERTAVKLDECFV